MDMKSNIVAAIFPALASLGTRTVTQIGTTAPLTRGASPGVPPAAFFAPTGTTSGACGRRQLKSVTSAG